MKMSFLKINKRAVLRKYVLARRKLSKSWEARPRLKKVQVLEGVFSEFRLWECTPDHVIVSTSLPLGAKPVMWEDVKDLVVPNEVNVFIFIVDAPLGHVKNVLQRAIGRHRVPYWDFDNAPYWDRGWKWKNCGETAHALWDTLDGRTIVMRTRTDKRNEVGCPIQTQKECYKLWRNGVYRNKGLPSDEFNIATCDLGGVDIYTREQAFTHMREQIKRVDYMRLYTAAGCEENPAPIRRRRL